MKYFSFKDLYEFICPFIKKSKSFNKESINNYHNEINTKITKLYENFKNEITKNTNKNIKFIITYNSIIELLVFKILKVNPIEFSIIFEHDKNFNTFINNNSVNDVRPKPFNDKKIFDRSLDLGILTKFNYDQMQCGIKIRNNFSIAHPFNEEIEFSYLEFYMVLLDTIYKINVEFKTYDENINLLFDKILSKEYLNNISEVHKIIKKQIDSWKENKKRDFFLDYCLGQIILIKEGFIYVNEDLLEMILDKINENNYQLLFNYIYELICKYKFYKFENINTFIIYDILLRNKLFFSYEKIYYIIKKILDFYMMNESNYYEFSIVNNILKNRNLISYIIEWSKKLNDNFAIKFYNWILISNNAGIAYNILDFEKIAENNESFFEDMITLLKQDIKPNLTKLQYRNDKLKHEFVKSDLVF